MLVLVVGARLVVAAREVEDPVEEPTTLTDDDAAVTR